MALGVQLTGFQVNGVDIGKSLITKEFILDRYPEMNNVNKMAGLWLSGDNTNGQLGNNTNGTKYSSPVQTVAGGANWKQVAAGSSHVMAIKTDGTLWGWGYNSVGHLGSGNTTSYSSPIQIGALTTWRQVSAGASFSGGIAADSTLWMWGSSASGQLGNNSLTGTSSPIQTIAAGTTWKMIACGPQHALAIKTNGTMWSWGLNTNGQLGDGTVVGKSSPVQIGLLTTWTKVYSTSMGGGDVSMAINSSNQLWVWGDNTNYQLGTGNTTKYSSPVQIAGGGTNWKTIAPGLQASAGIKTDGTLWTWGKNAGYQLGQGDLTTRSTPTQVGAWTTWYTVAQTGDISMMGITTNGWLYCWGKNTYGEFGDYSSNQKTVPFNSGGIQTWKSIAMGGGSLNCFMVGICDNTFINDDVTGSF
jgi:alpha-tubulin suppressor-like RCC1 family protein